MMIVSFAPAAAAQSQRIDDLVAQYKRAVVRIVVNDTRREGKKKDPQYGSGFIFRSRGGVTFVLTARHVIGSSAITLKNPDWAVEDNQVRREIEVWRITRRGELVRINADILPIESQMMPDADIALLQIGADGYETIKMVEQTIALGKQQDIVVLGFAADKLNLSPPLPQGPGGFPNVLTYNISVDSLKDGISGGPVIDLDTQRVLAIATKTKIRPDGNTYQATPVTLIYPVLAAFPEENSAQTESSLQENEYNQAKGDLTKLRQLLHKNCQPQTCSIRSTVEVQIKTLEEAEHKKQETQRWQSVYNAAHGDIPRLKAYVEKCESYCEFKEAALTEIASLEKESADKREKEHRAKLDGEEYRGARGDAAKLKAYIERCKTREFCDLARVELRSLEEKERRAQVARRDAADYEAARDDQDKLRKYIAACSTSPCQYKEAAQAEMTLLARQECDRTMATQFDTDVPASVPFVADTAGLRDQDIERAVASCNTVRQLAGANRRFITQAGRAHSARAVRRAQTAPPNESGARADLNEAVALWRSAREKGSGAAMNFLGAYERGLFNVGKILVAPAGDDKVAANKAALAYWEQGADAGNARAMRNAGSMLLSGPTEYPGIDVKRERARELLEKASDQGEWTAAAELGKAYFYGWQLDPDKAGGLALLKKSCAAGNKYAADFFDKEINNPAVERPKGCDSDRTSPAQARIGAKTYWSYGDSVMSLEVKGSERKFYYETPREGLVPVGVTRGTLFFDGKQTGNALSGSAYTFSKFCPPLTYSVTGTISSDGRQVELFGQQPNRDRTCNVVRYVDSSIKLTLRPGATELAGAK